MVAVYIGKCLVPSGKYHGVLLDGEALIVILLRLIYVHLLFMGHCCNLYFVADTAVRLDDKCSTYLELCLVK